jgi:hypothetical protein
LAAGCFLAFQAALDKIEDSKEKHTVMQLMTSWERKGRQEGRQVGRQEGQLATIQRQLRVQVGKLTPARERDLQGLAQAQLAELAEALLDFSSLADLKRWLAARHEGGGLENGSRAFRPDKK